MNIRTSLLYLISPANVKFSVGAGILLMFHFFVVNASICACIPSGPARRAEHVGQGVPTYGSTRNKSRIVCSGSPITFRISQEAGIFASFFFWSCTQLGCFLKKPVRSHFRLRSHFSENSVTVLSSWSFSKICFVLFVSCSVMFRR